MLLKLSITLMENVNVQYSQSFYFHVFFLSVFHGSAIIHLKLERRRERVILHLFTKDKQSHRAKNIGLEGVLNSAIYYE